MNLFLSDFQSRPLAYESTQEACLAWLASAHARAEVTRGGSADEAASFLLSMQKRLRRFGCSPMQISKRGHATADCTHTRWSEMAVYDVASDPGGAGAGVRATLFGHVVEYFFDDVYANEETPPRDLVHVTCTGYVAPSGAQRLVAKKGWGQRTRVTHAYHMGCYAAFPALRIASGQLALEPDPLARVDIAHTELCSLHLDPTDHDAEQLVVQSLFADGLIRYSLGREPRGDAPSLCILAQREEILPDSADAMSWSSSDRAMRMTLARDVPERIAGVLSGFLEKLHADAGLSFGRERAGAFFAVHPGGPRILDTVLARLELREAQIAASRTVLFEMGNMSSATIPHVWKKLLHDPDVAAGALIVSLAFGPGLTCAGALLRKV